MKTDGGTSIIALVPAYNESASIRDTIESLLKQERPLDRIVIIPNGCTDDTAQIAREYPVTVLELPKLQHRKSEALNRGWLEHAQDADIVISMDADTVFPSNAVGDWEQEFLDDTLFGGSTAKFTVSQKGFLGRLQKAEYAGSIQQALNQGYTTVLAGAGAAFSGSALKDIASRPDREGPWSYQSDVEDYELTYRLRQMGTHCVVSPTVRAYTDGMTTVKALWNQRIKWQAGTLEDLLRFGINVLTWKEYGTQLLNLVSPLTRILFLVVLSLSLFLDSLSIAWWCFLAPLLYVALALKAVLRVPHRDWKDVLIAVSIFPLEFLEILHGGWLLASWKEVVVRKITKRRRDLWEAQYKAEGV
jgi:cellulose synthase/poly-beta-1,6-N-acetylglucosamine synthase-like glycosyltransferase